MNLIFRDGALRRLPLWMIVTMLNTSVLVGAIVLVQVRQGRVFSPPRAQLLIVLWLAVVVYMLVGKVSTRCHRVEMTLPISTSTLWRRHFAAVVLGGALVLTGSTGVVLLHHRLLDRIAPLAARSPQEALVEISYLPLVFPLLAGLILAISLIDSIDPGLWTVAGSRSHWLRTIGSLGGVLVLLLLFQAWPWLSAGICLFLAMVVMRRTLRSLPASYRFVPLQPEVGSGYDAVVTAPANRLGTWQLYRTLFDVIHSCPPWKQLTPWMLYFFVALMGVLLSGGFDRWFDSRYLRFLYLPFGSYMLYSSIGLVTFHLFRFDPLPISRRSLFAVFMVPGLVIYTGAFAAGRLLVATDPKPRPLVNYRISPPSVWVDVEPRFMGIAFDGRPPTLESPWGETHQAWNLRPFTFAPLLTFNPYNTVEETSADFEALMTSRAIEAIYNTAVPPHEIRERYFVVENEQVAGLKENEFTLLDDYPGLKPPPTGPETPVYLALVLVPWLLCVSLFLSTFKTTSSPGRYRLMYSLGLVILIGGMLGQVVLSVAGVFDDLAARTIFAIFIDWLGTNRASTIATWLVSLVAIAACYRFALSCFESCEIPAGPINSLLTDWAARD